MDRIFLTSLKIFAVFFFTERVDYMVCYSQITIMLKKLSKKKYFIHKFVKFLIYGKIL